MDPLQAKHMEAGVPSENPEEAEDILFSRPQNRIPSNPFANPEARFDLAISSNATNRIHNPFTPFSDNDESEIEFDQRFSQAKRNRPPSVSTEQEVKLPPKGQRSPEDLQKKRRSISNLSFGFDSDEDRLDIGKLAKSLQEEQTRKSWRGDRSTPEPRRPSGDFVNVSTQNSTGVRTEDVIFTAAIFVSHLLSFCVDATLACWYYWDDGGGKYNFKWCSALTFFILVLGSFGVLGQFNQAEKDRLDRLFRHGRRIQILVNCFPPLGTILSSYYAVRSAFKANREQVYSVHFFAIEEFAQGLSRVQGFFQSAPQATLQLAILMETSGDISLGKGSLTLASVILSLMVMTIANLPGRSDMVATSVRKGIYSPVSRAFLGIRMISSFGSRTMALTYFLTSLRCTLGSSMSVVVGLLVITLPRFGFTLVDYFYHLRRVRRGRESPGQFGRLSLCGTLSGYMATIFFPMSHPLWVFWFIWIETVALMSIGLGVTLTSAGTESPCLSSLVNVCYTGIFVLLFVVTPVILPYARATVRSQRSRKIAKRIEQQEVGVANLQEPNSVTISV